MKRPFDIRIVLVGTLYDRNIGSVSRAMSNMGFTNLVLVNPKCEITFSAQQAAATGQLALQNRITYDNWKEFLENEPKNSIKIAFTARDGKSRLAQEVSQVFEFIKSSSPQFQVESDTPQTVHLIFGPEDCGLSAEDIDLSNMAAHIPTYGDNNSYNLAQATLLAMYEVRKSWGGKKSLLEGQQSKRKENYFDDVDVEATLKTWVQEMGFDLSKRKMNVFKVLRRMLLQNTPTKKEIVILETVLQQSIRKLREWKEYQKQKSN